LGSFKDYFEREYMEIRSAQLIEEMKNVKRSDGGAPGADEKHRDDRVIAAALAVIAWNDQLRARMMTQNQTYEAAQANSGLPAPQDVGGRMVQNMMQRIGFTEKVHKPRATYGGWTPPSEH
jgi:hypothetical protein